MNNKKINVLDQMIQKMEKALELKEKELAEAKKGELLDALNEYGIYERVDSLGPLADFSAKGDLAEEHLEN
jgi:hypothetical protein